MISKTGIHATLALVCMAHADPAAYTGATKIAAEVGAPPNYLGKLLKQLAQEGLLESRKGLNGGFKLARPPHKITLYDVVEPIDHISKWNGCLLGRGKCSETKPCPVHHRWSKVRREYLKFMKETTIAELADKQQTHNN